MNRNLGLNCHRVTSSLYDLHDPDAKVYITAKYYQDHVSVPIAKRDYVLRAYPGHRYKIVLIGEDDIRVMDVTDVALDDDVIDVKNFDVIDKKPCCC